MKRVIFFGAAIILMLSATFLIARNPPVPAPGTAVVAATFFPLADIVKHVGNGVVAVTQILPSGASPHTFEPRPSDVGALANARAVYAIGHGLDNWGAVLSETTGAPLVVVDRNIELRKNEEPEEEDHEEEEEEEHGPIDPHYWLSIPNAKKITQTIADDLRVRFPEQRDTIQANTEAYLRELDAADAEIRAIMAPIQNRNLVTFHDAWFYFADEYGFKVIATAEPAAGVEPSPRYLSALRKAIAETGVKTIYAEPQLSTDPLRPFIQDEKLRIATLDPEGATGAESYITMMRTNAQTIRNNQ